MKLRYDEDLVETSVLLSAKGRRSGIPPMQIRRFHFEREKLYSILDPDERNDAFFRLHLEWFREWGLEERLMEGVREFPLLERALAVLAFRQARGKKDEGSELYVNSANEKNGVVAIQIERLLDQENLMPFLRHELMHLEDMVDPAFEYSPETPAVGGPAAGPERLLIERYRLLWDISIDGRLRNSCPVAGRRQETYSSQFEAAFAFWPEAQRRERFNALWLGPRPAHRQLLEMAAGPRAVREDRPFPGGRCPLCGFPTHSWADRSRMGEGIQRRIVSEFPDWEADQGACTRCIEMYEAAQYALRSA